MACLSCRHWRSDKWEGWRSSWDVDEGPAAYEVAYRWRGEWRRAPGRCLKCPQSVAKSAGETCSQWADKYPRAEYAATDQIVSRPESKDEMERLKAEVKRLKKLAAKYRAKWQEEMKR
jgi:hypothetical protein